MKNIEVDWRYSIFVNKSISSKKYKNEKYEDCESNT